MTQFTNNGAVFKPVDPKFSLMIEDITKIFLKKRNNPAFMQVCARTLIREAADEYGYEIMSDGGIASLIQNIAVNSDLATPLIAEDKWNQKFLAAALKEFNT